MKAALEADKHVVVEYPLSLDLAQAEALIALADERQRLLHVEHIELLGGLHYATKEHLPRIGTPLYANNRTINGGASGSVEVDLSVRFVWFSVLWGAFTGASPD